MCDHKLIPIGTIKVETGQLLSIDPAHLDSDETRTLLRQLTSAAGLDSGGPARQLHFSHGHAGLGVVLTSGWGDGIYTFMADTCLDEHGFTIIRAIRIQYTDMGEAS